jgi:hypothetical protein
VSSIEFVCKDWSKYVEGLLPIYDVVINAGDKACTFGVLSANSKGDNYYFSTREKSYVLFSKGDNYYFSTREKSDVLLAASHLRTIADKLDELNIRGGLLGEGGAE